MSEKIKKQVDVRVVQESDPELFEVLTTARRPREKVREIFAEWSHMKAEREDLKARNEKLERELRGIEMSSRKAEKNSTMLLGMMNVLLFTQQVPAPFTPEIKAHAYYDFFDAQYRKMLNDVKQKKVYSDDVKLAKTRAVEAQLKASQALPDDNPF